MSSRVRTHLGWLLVTVLAAFIGCAVYWVASGGGARGGGTIAGYILGTIGLLLIVFASCYSIRRRLGAKGLTEAVGERSPEREKRLAQLNEAIADLQVEGSRDGAGEAALRKAATAAVVQAGFRGQIKVEVLPDESGNPLIRLVPREHPGRLENWLMAHQYLGVLIILVVLLHASFQFRGVLSLIVTVLTLATVASGMLGSLLYMVVPRWLVSIEAGKNGDRKNGDRPDAGAVPISPSVRVLNGVLGVWLYVHLALTGALLGAILVHVLSILYY